MIQNKGCISKRKKISCKISCEFLRVYFKLVLSGYRTAGKMLKDRYSIFRFPRTESDEPSTKWIATSVEVIIGKKFNFVIILSTVHTRSG